ncbi:5-methyltetrahydrofolate--homocysteine methyltransferase [Pilibacter termitis]|uniref:Methionine synthase n=1 Tax=Pilibacter termitis TaxID=263852 RepID=A0A1T4MPV8_9ENTE|nr:homocysteine S-methyltransferase family protein [Pilibacter termitis]SJZ68901.1 5-methyltetrahydrofolate--homocysteine methyltransferase [Pilibacter termitis]
MSTILSHIQEKHLVFDGAMGTQLQAKGLPIGMEPELFNLSHPEIVKSIHEDYVKAGADVITANTFQANRTKITPEELKEIIPQAIQLAKSANPKFVAYDMGPTGQLLAPMGTLSFDDAYDLFKEQALLAEKSGADVILVETISDLLEAKIAILAVKENTNLPIFVTMTYQEDGRTFVGCDAVTATLALQDLGIDALGVNCSLGPKELSGIVEEILEYAQVPVMVQANAGLPSMENGQTVYKISAEEYAQFAKKLLEKGVRIIGGCCGTTPEFIKKLREIVDKQELVFLTPKCVTAVTSGLQTVFIEHGKLTLIGERINPTGKKRLKEALRAKDLAYVLKEAVAQVESGADILDVNVGLPEIDEAEMMKKVVSELQGLITVPLQIDSSEVSALESGARHYNGKPLINSVNGKTSSMESVFPIAKKYGGVVLGLCLDDSGIPETVEERFNVAKKIVETAESYGISRNNVMIDPLALPVSARQEQAEVTLGVIKRVTEELGVKTVIGLSNISFGLPNRSLLNSVFMTQAVGVGLTAPIMNTLDDFMMNIVRSLKVFTNQDKESAEYIANAQNSTISIGNKNVTTPEQKNDKKLTLKEMIISGRRELTAEETARLLDDFTPLEIVDHAIVPALNVVGDQFERGELFLPQLMQSAEATKNAQEVLKAKLLRDGAKASNQGKILLATVEGDIHDIGKNIVKMVLENYGYQIIDLGKDVPVAEVVRSVKEEKIELVGLSALMTTTVQNMKRTITALREAGCTCKVMVGGAVLNEEYKEFVGADFYSKDAMEGVRIAESVFGK